HRSFDEMIKTPDRAAELRPVCVHCAIALRHVPPRDRFPPETVIDALKGAVPDLVAVATRDLNDTPSSVTDAAIEVRYFAAAELLHINRPANDKAHPDLVKLLARREKERSTADGKYHVSSSRQHAIMV